MAELKYIRHEHLAREYIRTGGNGAEAYRRVTSRFPNKPLRNRKAAAVIACGILKRPEVKRRVQELKDIMAKKSDITIEKVLTDYQVALEMAKGMGKPADVISAATAQAKLVGLLRDRVETGAVGDFDGIDNLPDILDKVAAEAGPEAAVALAKAFGLEAEPPSELINESPPTDAVN